MSCLLDTACVQLDKMVASPRFSEISSKTSSICDQGVACNRFRPAIPHQYSLKHGCAKVMTVSSSAPRSSASYSDILQLCKLGCSNVNHTRSRLPISGRPHSSNCICNPTPGCSGQPTIYGSKRFHRNSHRDGKVEAGKSGTFSTSSSRSEKTDVENEEEREEEEWEEVDEWAAEEGEGSGDSNAFRVSGEGQLDAELEEEARAIAANFQQGLLGEMSREDDDEEREASSANAFEESAETSGGDGGRDDEESELAQGKGSTQVKKRLGRNNKLTFTAQVPDHLLPRVAIVGRPNVGKSALFNRIAGRDLAIVFDEPGVTRDRLYTRAFWLTHEFLVADTGGVLTPASSAGRGDAVAITSAGGADAVTEALKEAAAAGLPAMIESQAARAVEGAQSVIFVVDGQAGITAADEEIAAWLRRKYAGRKSVTLAVNKCESPSKGAMQVLDFWGLGFQPYAVSAISGSGTGELLDAVCAELVAPNEEDEEEEKDADSRPLAIAITGRPNVGKSSILNALVGEQRTVVSPVSGTTRDAIDTDFTGDDGKEYRLIDTAGIRRRGAVAAANSKVEALSVNRAFRAIRRADVVALVIDAMLCVTEQDFRIGERIDKEGKACVIVVNKWDMVPEKESTTTLRYTEDVRARLRCLDWAPIVFTSATEGQRIPRILLEARKAGDERAKRLSTAVLNQVVHEALAFKQPPGGKAGKRGRVYYCTQAAVRPPTFVFFVNEAKLFPELYRRYIEKQLRKNVGFPGTPIRLLWRSKRKRVHFSRRGSGGDSQSESGDRQRPMGQQGPRPTVVLTSGGARN
eukprot:TRINITY_DN17099_c0_g1_i1.p1 TRINITY_DN17099_c0_g1~~TRINITY_DN17099_c0_g1_i1.p1  ORF type:complete len:804 (+),score=164.42 TRINITY_DN17099_c0_g1_i1:305-2716(+)